MGKSGIHRLMKQVKVPLSLRSRTEIEETKTGRGKLFVGNRISLYGQ